MKQRREASTLRLWCVSTQLCAQSTSACVTGPGSSQALYRAHLWGGESAVVSTGMRRGGEA